MASLQVRELPEPLYQKLVEVARREHRSIAQQAIIVLAEGLNVSLSYKDKRRDVIRVIREDAEALAKYNLSDPVKMIRADRDR